RACNDGCCPLPNWLKVKCCLSFLGRQHGGILGSRIAGYCHVAKELDVSAQRDRRQLPPCPMLVIEADEFGAEADRELPYTNAAPAADQIMPHLMHEDDNRQNDQERNDRADDEIVEAEKCGEKVGQCSPLRLLVRFE